MRGEVGQAAHSSWGPEPEQLGWDWLLSCRFLQGRPQAEFLLQAMLEARSKAPEAFPTPPAHQYRRSLPPTMCAGKENQKKK